MTSLARRALARWRIEKSIAFWHHRAYAPAALSDLGPHVEAPRRGTRVLHALVEEKLLRLDDVRVAPEASFEDLRRVHPPHWLEASATAETLARIFAMDPAAVPVDELLGAARRAVGGTLAAAAAVARGEVKIGFNLGGGFHHAEPDQGSGFCVYNDVAVAIAALRADGFARPVAIVDLDYHQGNGNLVAFASDSTVLTYSIHGSVWSHVEAQADVGVVMPAGTGDEAYLARLEATLPAALAAHKPALIFYIAGNDVLGGDALGDFTLTPAGVLARDRRVAACAAEAGAGLVVTLGGGYGPLAWRCSAAFARFLLSGDAHVEPLLSAPDPEALFSRIAAELDPAELQREADSDFTLSESDVLADLGTRPHARLFLDYYSAAGVELAMERYGLLPRLGEKGFSDVRVECDLADRSRQIVRVFGARAPGEKHLLVELVARRRTLEAPAAGGLGAAALAASGAAATVPAPGSATAEVLFVEWLLLQDPSASFTLARPPLPGQKHPGLGVSVYIREMLVQACRRLGLEALVNHPSHYHTAAVVHPRARFLDPKVEGAFLATRDALAGREIGEISARVEAGAMQLRDGTPLAWQPSDHVLPVSERFLAYFASKAYADAADAERKRLLDAGLHAVEPGGG